MYKVQICIKYSVNRSVDLLSEMKHLYIVYRKYFKKEMKVQEEEQEEPGNVNDVDD